MAAAIRKEPNYISAKGAILYFDMESPRQVAIAKMFAETLTAHTIQPGLFKRVDGIRGKLIVANNDDTVVPATIAAESERIEVVQADSKKQSAENSVTMDRICEWLKAHPEWAGSRTELAKTMDFPGAKHALVRDVIDRMLLEGRIGCTGKGRHMLVHYGQKTVKRVKGRHGKK